MIIDAHSHVHDPVRDHVTLMRDADVDRAVLFATRPHPERADSLSDLRSEFESLASAVNGSARDTDGVRTAWQELDAALLAEPEKFIGFRSVLLDQPPAKIAESVANDVVATRYAGIGELTPPPDMAHLVEPVLQAASDHGALPVVVHGAAPTTEADLGTLVGLAHRYPTTPLVISQLAGNHWLAAIEAARDTANLYLELSTASLIFAVRLAIREVPDRTLFGSDAPYGDPSVTRLAVERVTSPGTVRDLVLGDTMAELLAR